MAMETVGVKLEPDLLARIDALVPRLSTAWHEAKRSEALRAAIKLGVEQLEAKFGTGPTPAPSPPAPGMARP